MASAPGYHYKDGNRHIFRLPHIFKYEQKEKRKKLVILTCDAEDNSSKLLPADPFILCEIEVHVMRRQRFQNRWVVLEHIVQPDHGDGSEPREHDGGEGAAHFARAESLDKEEEDQDHHAQDDNVTCMQQEKS
jgi:hypothetical protein